MATEWTFEAARTAALAIKAAGIPDVRVMGTDHVRDGKVVEVLRVEAVIRDAKHGNTILRAITTPDGFDAAKVAKDMIKDQQQRAKGTRSRVRIERELDRS